VSDIRPDDGNVFRSAVVGITQPNGAPSYGLDLDLFNASVAGSLDVIRVEASSGSDRVWLSAVAAVYDL
jgi:hypothetical protein